MTWLFPRDQNKAPSAPWLKGLSSHCTREPSARVTSIVGHLAGACRLNGAFGRRGSIRFPGTEESFSPAENHQGPIVKRTRALVIDQCGQALRGIIRREHIRQCL